MDALTLWMAVGFIPGYSVIANDPTNIRYLDPPNNDRFNWKEGDGCNLYFVVWLVHERR